MAFAPLKAVYDQVVAGRFTEVDCRNVFEYSKPCATPFEGFDRQLYVGPNCEVRYARITKSRAHVVVDEAADGSPVVEVWKTRAHKEYQSQPHKA